MNGCTIKQHSIGLEVVIPAIGLNRAAIYQAVGEEKFTRAVKKISFINLAGRCVIIIIVARIKQNFARCAADRADAAGDFQTCLAIGFTIGRNPPG